MKLFSWKNTNVHLCPNCREPVTDQMVFCDSCGLRLHAPPACLRCNLPLAPQTNFCEACGTPVGVAPLPESADTKNPSESGSTGEPDPVVQPGPAVAVSGFPGQSVSDALAEPAVPHVPSLQNESEKNFRKSRNRQSKKRSRKKKIQPSGPDNIPEKTSPLPESSGSRQNPEDPQVPVSSSGKAPGDTFSIGQSRSQLIGIFPRIVQKLRTNLRAARETRVLAGLIAVGLLVIFVIVASLAVIAPVIRNDPGLATTERPPAGNPGSGDSLVNASPGVQPVGTILPVTPGPTRDLPDHLAVWLQAERDPITNEVTVIFDGGKGQLAVREVLVRLTRSDRQVLTAAFRPFTIGEGVSLQGTKFSDRIEVIITCNTGDQYTVIDKIFEYKQRN